MEVNAPSELSVFENEQIFFSKIGNYRSAYKTARRCKFAYSDG